MAIIAQGSGDGTIDIKGCATTNSMALAPDGTNFKITDTVSDKASHKVQNPSTAKLSFLKTHVKLRDEVRHGKAFQGLLERYFG